jgi:allantoin racemase
MRQLRAMRAGGSVQVGRDGRMQHRVLKVPQHTQSGMELPPCQHRIGRYRMRIKVINPNTTAGMTAKIGEAARAVAAPGTEIVAVNPAAGPVSIESHYDEAVSVLGILEEVHKGEAEGCDGYVIACFGDPGLLAAREVASGPVVGIAEAAMHAASFIATDRYGMMHACRKVRGTDIPVLDLEETGSAALDAIVKECSRAVADDRCGAIVLGCAGMADLVAAVQRAVGVPVIDGVAAAVVQVEGLVRLGLGTSKHGDLAWPPPKTYTGNLAQLAPKARMAAWSSDTRSTTEVSGRGR